MNSAAPALSPRIQRLLRPDVLAMHAYGVQDARGLIKLDAMENPYRLSPELQQALGARLGAVALNRYPGEQVQAVREALMRHAEVPEGCGIVLGNGSDELISLVAIACDVPGASILAPGPGFVMYALSAQLQGLRFHEVPLAADFTLDEATMLRAIAEHQPSIVYLAYPNNPTANLWDEEAMHRIIAAAPGLVVIDEAYQPFAGKSFLQHLPRHENLLLMRTMSKFGLAGVRIGYLLGPAALVGEINKVRPPYNISNLNLECALFALEHAEVFAAQAQAIVQERETLLRALAELPGVHVFPSDANMVLVRVQPPPQAVFAHMRAQGVLIKNVSTTHPLLAGCLRLTVGTPEENRAMLAALAAALKELSP
jgi:histidinol-phosphate aminotransferase